MDVIRFPNGETFAGYFWTHLARDIQGIEQFRLVQDQVGHVEMQVIPEPNANPGLLDIIKSQVNKKTGSSEYFSVREVEKLPRNQAGKAGLVISHYQPENE